MIQLNVDQLDPSAPDRRDENFGCGRALPCPVTC
jgi:hypothetical protein